MEDHKIQRGLMVILKGLSCEGRHALWDWRPSGITDISKDTWKPETKTLTTGAKAEPCQGSPQVSASAPQATWHAKEEKTEQHAPLAQKLSCRSLFATLNVCYTQSSTNFCWIELMDCLISFCFKLKWHSNHPLIFFSPSP